MKAPKQTFFLVALLAVAAAVPALAQTAAPATYPAACEASKVSKLDSDRAHALFISGKQFLDESNYDKAISYFKDAYTLDCSVHEILSNFIATAYERKGDRQEAIRALEEYVKRAPTASDREKIERRIKNLKDQLNFQPSATVVPTATTAAPTASTASSAPTSAPTSPPLNPPSKEARSAIPLVVAGVGAAVAITGGLVFISGSSKVSDAEKACPARQNCLPEIAQKGNDGRSLETIGVVVGSLGLAAVAGGLVWYFVQPPRDAKTAKGIRFQPSVSPGYAGAALGGAF